MLSRKTRYAMNALVYLGGLDNRHPVPIAEIARASNAPRKFLETILLELKKAGILASKRGKGGGYYLLKHPKQVTLAEVMSVLDGPLALIPCASSRYYEPCKECKSEEACGMRFFFLELRQKTDAVLKRATLKKIIEREQNYFRLKNL
jgi:Rrf2 family protein